MKLNREGGNMRSEKLIIEQNKAYNTFGDHPS